VLKSQTEQPQCFGELFDSKAAECVGGFDSKWTGVGGSHIRPLCDFVNACAQKTQQAESPQQVIPPGNLIRPQPHTTFGTSSTPGYPRPSAPPTPMQSRAWAPPSQQVTTPTNYGAQHYVHPTQFAGHYGVPQYLTVRQPVSSGPILERMWWETLRSVGKAIGHTLANFFDSEVFGRHGGPGPGNSSG